MRVSYYWVTYVLLVAVSAAVLLNWYWAVAITACAYPAARALTGYVTASPSILVLEAVALALVELWAGLPAAAAYGVGLLVVVLVDGAAAVYLSRSSLLDGVIRRWIRANAIILPVLGFTLIPSIWRLYA